VSGATGTLEVVLEMNRVLVRVVVETQSSHTELESLKLDQFPLP
jgi:hypothetical protein